MCVIFVEIHRVSSVCLCSDAEEKPEPKEKSSGGRKSHRYHPYKERHGGGGDKKAAHRNRVFISNIPYDMKWQAIKDLMREKGNPRRERSVTVPSSPSLVYLSCSGV